VRAPALFKKLFDGNFGNASRKPIDHGFAVGIVLMQDDEVSIIVHVIVLCLQVRCALFGGLQGKSDERQSAAHAGREILPLISCVRDEPVDDLGHCARFVRLKSRLSLFLANRISLERAFGDTAQLVCELVNRRGRLAKLGKRFLVDAGVLRDVFDLVEVGFLV